MAATVQARYFSGASEGTGASAEGGITFGKDELITSTAPISKPTATGTNMSWYKVLGLYVTAGGGSTTLLNRKIRFASGPSTGLTGAFKAAASYTQAASGNAPADSGSANGNLPATYTALSTSFQSWDNATEAATNSDRNGSLCQVTIGVDNLYAGGGGPSIALPNLELQYDEQ